MDIADSGNMTMRETVDPKNDPVKRRKAMRLLLVLALFSIVMVFAGLTSGYIVALNGKFWVQIALPKAFYYSTAIIILSSVSIWLANRFAKRKKSAPMIVFLIITLLLGIGFAVSQFNGYKELVNKGMYVSGVVANIKGTYGKDYKIHYNGKVLLNDNGKYYYPDDYYHDHPLNDDLDVVSNTASSFLYIITFVHVLHVVGGIIALIIAIILVFAGRVGVKKPFLIKQTALYWHFLDILWIYLFIFLGFIH